MAISEPTAFVLQIDVISNGLHRDDSVKLTFQVDGHDCAAHRMESLELVSGFEEPLVQGLHGPGFFDVWRHSFMVNCFLMPLKYGKNLKWQNFN
jgi:hypothetical protein